MKKQPSVTLMEMLFVGGILLFLGAVVTIIWSAVHYGW